MGRTGWTQIETQRLMELADKARESGRPLSEAFRQAAEETGRKPDSVRNRYYALMRESGSCAAVSRPFTEDEARELARDMLLSMSGGRSVRGAALELAGGDASLMLRYQNKFRSLEERRPELIREIAAEAGLSPVPAKRRVKPRENAELERLRALAAEQAEELKRRHERIAALGACFYKLCGLTRELISASKRGRIPSELEERTLSAIAELKP